MENNKNKRSISKKEKKKAKKAKKKRSHNLELISRMPQALPETVTKELFMANLGMVKVSHLYESLMEDMSSKRQTRQTQRKRDLEDQSQPTGIIYSRLLQMQSKIVDHVEKLKQQQQQQQQQQTNNIQAQMQCQQQFH